MTFTEDLVEQAALEIFQELGWRYAEPLEISPDGPNRARISNGEVVLGEMLNDAAQRLNTDIPSEAIEQAIKQVQVSEMPSLIEENRRTTSCWLKVSTLSFADPMAQSKATRSD